MTTYQLKHCASSDNECINLIQITDSHLFSDTSGKLLGLETENSLRAVVEDIGKSDKGDLILATGDLSQDASDSSYQRFAQHLSSLATPTFWIPGNHDKISVMERSLVGDNVYPHKRILVNKWQIILLDTSVDGKVHGYLADEALEFLHCALKEKSDYFALIVLHHQPVKIDSHWLDGIGLKNNAEFMALLALHAQIRGLLWGHIHQEYEQQIGNIKLMATPSTCVQFQPQSQDFEAGRQAPGYRRLKLMPDGTIQSKVIRIASQPFEVDYSIKGY